MVSGRLLLLLAALAAGSWLWKSGQWQVLQERLLAAAAQAGLTGGPLPAGTITVPAAADAATPAPATPIRTWVDADGVRHFTNTGLAPEGSREHALGTTGRLPPPTVTAAVSPPPASTTAPPPRPAADNATGIARQLMQEQEARFDAIRRENNR